MAFRKLTDFIQAEVVVGMIIDKLNKTMVARNVVAIRTMRELGRGSSYKFPRVGDLTVNQYTGTGIAPENATSSSETIILDHFPFINFYLEDSDIAESSALTTAGAYADEAAYKIANDIDKTIFADVHSGATTSATLGVTGTPIQINTREKALSYIETLATKMKEANIESDAAIVVPPYIEIYVTTELGTKASNQGLSGKIESGRLGMLYGVEIYSSNNLPAGVLGGLAAGEYGVVGGKRSCFGLVEGTVIVKDGPSETKPASFNQYGMVYGDDFLNTSGWFAGVVTK